LATPKTDDRKMAGTTAPTTADSAVAGTAAGSWLQDFTAQISHRALSLFGPSPDSLTQDTATDEKASVVPKTPSAAEEEETQEDNDHWASPPKQQVTPVPAISASIAKPAPAAVTLPAKSMAPVPAPASRQKAAAPAAASIPAQGLYSETTTLGWRKTGEVRIFLKRHPTTRQLGFALLPDSHGYLVVKTITKGHSAEGKIFVGDRILAIDGTRIVPGTSLDAAVKLINDCTEELVGLVISDESRIVTLDTGGARLGLDLEGCPYPRPVKIKGVHFGSHGEAAGLVVGDFIISVNGTRTYDREQCVRLINERVGKGELNLQVRTINEDNGPTTPTTVVGKMVRSLSFQKRNKKQTGTPRGGAKESPRAAPTGGGSSES